MGSMSSVRKLAVASTVAIFGLITLGGVVRATGSGLGCADAWPDCNGRWIPDFTNHHVVIEFSHRVVAAIVMVMMGVLMVKALRMRAAHPEIARLSVAAFVLVLFQAGLGAVVVKLHLEAVSVVVHMTAAVSLFALLIAIILKTGYAPGLLEGPSDRSMSVTARAAAGAALFLMMVGSYMSGVEGSGRAFDDWPLMGGEVIPSLATHEQSVHFLHRAVALIVGAILVVSLLSVIRRKASMPGPARLAHAVLGLFAVEVLIGAVNVWTGLNAVAVTLHLVVAVLIWGALVTMALITSPGFRQPAARHQTAAEAAGQRA